MSCNILSFIFHVFFCYRLVPIIRFTLCSAYVMGFILGSDSPPLPPRILLETIPSIVELWGKKRYNLCNLGIILSKYTVDVISVPLSKEFGSSCRILFLLDLTNDEYH